MANGLFTLKQQVEALRQGAWSGYIAPKWVEYLVVAGGGGGGYTGGGGAGGVLTGIATVAAGTSYTVTIGTGGVGSTSGGDNAVQGLASVFGSISALGGGAGILNYTASAAKNNGGSGGGGGLSTIANGQGTAGQGNAGGLSSASNGGGGGGAGTVGLAAAAVGGNGGAGIASAITGTVTTYGGGGGGGFSNSINTGFGSGGVGGGGSSTLTAGTNGGINTGGGGGAASYSNPTFYAGGSGGSGIVVVRYPGNVQFFSGGTINYTNGHIVHIFTASGTLAPILPVVYNTSHQISRSLRFNSADSTNLTRTPASATNRRTWTFSAWMKRSTISTYQMIMAAAQSNGNNEAFMYFVDNNIFNYFEVDGTATTIANVGTTAVFRDPSAWYHIVYSVDTTQATSTNRIKIYVNGVDVTNTSSPLYPAQNLQTAFNMTYAHFIGTRTSSTQYLNAYLTDINFIDGQALTPASFGATSTTTGVWAPIRYLGTYGTNGFYLNFSDNSNTTASTLGKDYSPNGNNWTPNNFSVTAGAGNDSLVDTPTQYGFDTGVGGSVRGNYNTMNPLNKGSTVTLTNGNLDQVTASGGWNSARGTIAVSSGKWYWEVTITGTTQSVMHGVDDNAYNVITNPSSSYVGAYQNSWGVYASNGDRRNNTGAGTAYGSSFAQNDVMMVALDMDTGKIWWGKNGTWFASGSPSAGTNAAYTNLSGYTLNPATSGFDTTDSCTHNFGQRAFAYAAPSGYKALCTTNLPTPAIGSTSETLATSYFAPVTYTGTNATQSITTGFQPDFVWIKMRSNVSRNSLFDVIRGVTKVLWSDSVDAEGTSNAGTGLTSLNSNGFTLGTEIAGTNGSTNVSGSTYVAWNWKAGGTAVTNRLGTIESTTSVNPTSEFSVVTYTGNGTSGATIGHGLDVTPSMIILKSRSGGTYDWRVYHSALTAGYNIALNTTAAQYQGSGGNAGFISAVTPTTFTLTQSGANVLDAVNINGGTYVAYCFAEVAGYSKFGSYTGNGSTDGPFVFTGFRPAFVMIKRSSSTGDWFIYNNKTSTYNVVAPYLVANSSGAEGTYTTLDFLSNGFKLRVSDAEVNGNGSTLIYMAFAENPFKHSLAR